MDSPALSRWGVPWTDQDDAKLSELLQQSLSDRDIAAALGRTVTGINQRKAKLGLHKAKHIFWSQKDLATLKDPANHNRTNDDLAKELRKSRWTVRSKRKALGLPYRTQRQWTQEEKDLLSQLYPDGGYKPVAERTGWGQRSIENMAQKLGVRRRR